MKSERFEDIEGWRLARQLARDVFSASCEGTFAHDFGLRDQINRATGSAMDNITEGFDGGSDADFIHILGYTQRFCTETQSQLYRALDREHMGRQGY